MPQWSNVVSNYQLPITWKSPPYYGARRSYNGGPYNTSHEGTDFAAYGGTAVTAPAAGTIVLAEPLAARGGAVIIDHGLGVYSGYYHLSTVGAEAGPGSPTRRLHRRRGHDRPFHRQSSPLGFSRRRPMGRCAGLAGTRYGLLGFGGTKSTVAPD